MTLAIDHPFRQYIRKLDGRTLWAEERYGRAAAREASRNGFDDIASWHRDRADAIADEMENRITEMEGRTRTFTPPSQAPAY